MKSLSYCILLFSCILYFGCNKEEITDWTSIVPGHYTGDISISTDLESNPDPNSVGMLPYIYKTHSSFSTTADVTYNGYGFIISFEENEILGKEVVGVFIAFSDNRKASLGLSNSPGISKPKQKKMLFSGLYSGDAIYLENNELSINVSYTYYHQTDSAIGVHFDLWRSLN